MTANPDDRSEVSNYIQELGIILTNASVSGKVSVSFAMENSSASSSDSELGSRRGSRRASMDVALRLVDFAQSVVQESREPQGSRSRSGDSNQASALDRFDSPSACCEDSHGNAESSRPSRLRPHVCIKYP